jgi:hypothetical protein
VSGRVDWLVVFGSGFSRTSDQSVTSRHWLVGRGRGGVGGDGFGRLSLMLVGGGLV